MAQLLLNASKLAHNLDLIHRTLQSKNIQWAVVSKLLCGSKVFITELLDQGITHFCDSRLANLQAIRAQSRDAYLMYIKPVPLHAAEEIVNVANCSFCSQPATLEALSKAAVHQNTTHDVMLMVELGEGREGAHPHEVPDLAKTCLELPGLRLIGLGANLTCMFGVLPSEANMNELARIQEEVYKRTHHRIPLLSGGSSVVYPLVLENILPESINHFRIGETLFFGTDVYHGKPLDGYAHDVLKLRTRIVELAEKKIVPEGELGANLEGKSLAFSEEDKNKTSIRALVDVGLLDVDTSNATLANPNHSLAGASSDLMVIDLGNNPEQLQVGDSIWFNLNYLSALRLMNSYYVEKVVETAS